MTIEEKAKAYDEALEKAKAHINSKGIGDTVDLCRHLFPELRESEDEKVRKFLVRLAERCSENSIDFIGDIKKADVLAWLEKQKSKDNEEEYLDGIKKDWFERGKKEVLTIPELYGLEKQKEQPKEELVYRLNGLMQDYIKEGKDDEEKEHRFKCYQLFWDALEDTSYFEQKEQKPAEWSANDKAFIKDCANILVANDYATSAERLLSMFPVKPAEWSKEDEDMLNSCISSIEEAKENRYAYKETDGDTSYDHEIAWLKSLRSRPKSSDNWKPSEDQMNVLLNTEGMIRASGYPENAKVLASLYEQLKKL